MPCFFQNSVQTQRQKRGSWIAMNPAQVDSSRGQKAPRGIIKVKAHGTGRSLQKDTSRYNGF